MLEIGDTITIEPVYEEETLWVRFKRWAGRYNEPRKLKQFRVTTSCESYAEYDPFPFDPLREDEDYKKLIAQGRSDLERLSRPIRS